MEMGATVAFQEDGSWQNEAEHQQQLKNEAGQGVEIRIRWSQSHQAKNRMTKKLFGTLRLMMSAY